MPLLEDERLPCYGDWTVAHAAQWEGPDGPWIVWVGRRCITRRASEDVARLTLRSMGVEWTDLRFIDSHQIPA